mgnify:CR=1 FL=1
MSRSTDPYAAVDSLGGGAEAISYVLDRQVSADQSMFSHVDWSAMPDKADPTFSTKTIATVFFQRSDHWLRWVESKGRTIDPSTKKKFDVERDSNNNRLYHLPDIERLAKILHANGAISYTRMMIALRLVWLIGVGYEAVSVD